MISPFIDRHLHSSGALSDRAKTIVSGSSAEEIRHAVDILLLENNHLKDLWQCQRHHCDRIYQASYIAISVNLMAAVIAPWLQIAPANVALFTCIFQALNALTLYVKSCKLRRIETLLRVNQDSLSILGTAIKLQTTL